MKGIVKAVADKVVSVFDLADIPLDRGLNIINMIADEAKGTANDVAETLKKIVKD